MSGVDVLAVLAKAAESVEDEFSHDLGMREAIAAVAELIDVMEDYLAAVDEADATYADEHDKAVREKAELRQKLDAALARVQP